jgi:hypothetical protein
MYDTKITTGNKNYLHHYIITNVLYSILSGNINLKGDEDRAINKPYDDKYYYGIDGIESNRLKITDMNNSILSNDNQFREYYKSRYSDLYKSVADDEIKKIYDVFLNIFAEYTTVPKTETEIDTYFKGTVLTKETILKIYSIIKKCFELFNEDRFNNNLVYYNNRDPNKNSATQITIESYKRFAFYKNGDKLIPHQFILKLKSSEYAVFVGDVTGTKSSIETGFDTALGKFNPPILSTATDMTPILEDDISDEDSINQKEDIRNKNVIKIIAKYLLILGHINYNGIEYKKEVVSSVAPIKTQETVDSNKKQIFDLRTRNLYRLFSNVSYNDTYDGIDDTFTSIYNASNDLKISTPKYKTLTYMYNYLETKYVSLSSNNNKNYLLNVVTSINNTLNNDDKIITATTGSKESKYLFAKKINEMKVPPEYEDEDAIYTKADYISTTSFETTYYICFFIY